jgi:murein DD-endopeptidase MepM/ murein hydrolase activator NlpD
MNSTRLTPTDPRRRDLRVSQRQPAPPRAVRRSPVRIFTAVLAAFSALALVLPAGLPAFGFVLVDQEASPTSPIDAQTLAVDPGISASTVDRDAYQVIRGAEGGLRPYSSTADTFVNDPNSLIQWPFTVGVPISSWFGYREKPWPGFHTGLDMNPGVGTPIQAAADGVVTEVSDGGTTYGTFIIIDHEVNGVKFSTVYAHMLAGSRSFEVGDRVSVTDIVGLVGSTGLSTGAHLHFEVRLDGEAVDPYAWMKEKVGS